MVTLKKIIQNNLKCSFKDSIDRVYEVLTDAYLFNDFMKDFVGEVHFIKGNSIGEEDAEFMYYLEKQYLMHVTITKVIRTKITEKLKQNLSKHTYC
jgi:hypothetical protein